MVLSALYITEAYGGNMAAVSGELVGTVIWPAVAALVHTRRQAKPEPTEQAIREIRPA